MLRTFSIAWLASFSRRFFADNARVCSASTGRRRAVDPLAAWGLGRGVGGGGVGGWGEGQATKVGGGGARGGWGGWREGRSYGNTRLGDRHACVQYNRGND